MDINTIKNELEKIRTSVINDVGTALEIYFKHASDTGEGIGFWAIPRMLFPEIDGLGSFYAGDTEPKNNSKNAVAFMREYFGRINPRYKEISGFIYHVYRNSLIHSHYPKNVVLTDDKKIFWMFGLNVSTVHHLKSSNNVLYIDCQAFYEDFLKTSDYYIKDFDDSSKQKELMRNFETAYNLMHEDIKKEQMIKKSYIKDTDLNYFCNRN